jgi:acyl-CoA synthetase (AMP-forming)/AMP-acid ligase II/thioesterase domain-containing protein/acyl carrier protein
MSVSRASVSLVLSESAAQSALPASIADLLLRAAERYPTSGLRLLGAERQGEGIFLSYSALLDEAQRILGGLQTCRLSAGDNVVLLLERAVDFVPAFWACVLGGYVPCPLVQMRNEPASWAKHVAQVDSLLGHPVFITVGALRNKLQGVNVADLETLRAGTPQEALCAGRLTDPAFVALTPGSADNLKAVVLTHENILASMVGKAERLKLAATDVILNWVPLNHAAALLEGHMLPLNVGATQLHVERAALQAQPLLYLRLIDRYRVTVAFAPDFVLGQIKAALQAARPGATRRQMLKCNLFSLRHLISSAEPNVVEGGRLYLDFLAQFGLVRTAVWRAFGMTETCAGSVYSCEFPVRDRSREFATLGVPITGLQMRIADERGALLPPGEAGELQLRGPMVFNQYYNNEGATNAAFTADGWFRSGSLGRVEDGHLDLLGRKEDSITIEGAQYFSHELETALEKLDGIERSFVAVFPARLKRADTEHLVVLFATSFAWSDEARLYQLTVAVRNTAALLWGLRPALILPLPKDTFSKSILGKIERAVLRRRLEAGELSAYETRIADLASRHLGRSTPAAGPAEVAIAAIYAELLGLDSATLSATTSFFDLGGTSLDVPRLKQKLEQRLGLTKLQAVTILKNPTVRGLAASIASGRVQEKTEYDPIVPLQLSGTRTPLFFVHPDTGEVLDFVNLANHFTTERPVYALRARGFNDGEKCFTTLDELVSTYVDAIRRRQPNGPYAVAGYSYGGVIAFEIAKVLEAEGERVAFVASFNLPPYMKYRLKEGAGVEGRVAQSLLALGHSYVPSGTVGSMTVFYTHPVRGTKQDWLNNELKQWDEFTRLRNRYIEVAGEPHTLMGPKHVYTFQSVLRAELDRALGGR